MVWNRMQRDCILFVFLLYERERGGDNRMCMYAYFFIQLTNYFFTYYDDGWIVLLLKYNYDLEQSMVYNNTPIHPLHPTNQQRGSSLSLD